MTLAPLGSAARETGVSIAGLLAALRRYVCPECLAGKHDGCDGRGGFDEDDLPVPCACWADGHQL